MGTREFVIAFILTTVLIGLDCRHSTAPPPPSGPDTTSHDFVWRMDTIGGKNPSVVRDVAIVNDTCIWAVGEIYPPNPSGPYASAPYGSALWDGRTWTPIQVPYHDYGTSELRPGVLFSIWAFSPSSIYAVSYANLLKWDGQTWTEKAFFMTGLPWNGQITKMWARNENDIYLVGRNGSIYHFVGTSWTKMTSGTTVDLLEVWGDLEKGVVWACGQSSDGYHSVLVKYENGQWRTIWARDGTTQVSPFGYNVGSVWSSKSTYVVGSTGLYRIEGDTTNSTWLTKFSDFTNCMRGNGEYDIAGAGVLGIVWHYNGSTWRELRGNSFTDVLYSCDLKGNTIVAVGSDNSTFLAKSLFYIGKRQ